MLLNELALHLLRRADNFCFPFKRHLTATNFTEDFWPPNVLIFITCKYDGRHPVAVGCRAVACNGQTYGGCTPGRLPPPIPAMVCPAGLSQVSVPTTPLRLLLGKHSTFDHITDDDKNLKLQCHSWATSIICQHKPWSYLS